MTYAELGTRVDGREPQKNKKKTRKYDPPLYNTIRHADLYIPKVLFDPKTFVYLWKLFIWNFVLS